MQIVGKLDSLTTPVFSFRERASTTYPFSWQLRRPSPRFEYSSKGHSGLLGIILSEVVFPHYPLLLKGDSNSVDFEAGFVTTKKEPLDQLPEHQFNTHRHSQQNHL